MKSVFDRIPTLAVMAIAFLAIGSTMATAQSEAEIRAQVRVLVRACYADFQRLCPGMQPGGGRVLACLQGHDGELTKKCQEALPKAQALSSKASEGGFLPQRPA